MKKEVIGGQAVVEGVMLRSPSRQAIAVRSADGKIITEVSSVNPLGERWPLLRLPLLRGVVVFGESLGGAISSLAVSANLANPEEQITPLQMTVVALISLAFGIGLFFLSPAILIDVLASRFYFSSFAFTVLESLMRVTFFIGYLLLVGLIGDIRRTFEYHGAEHKAIACWEQGKTLTATEAVSCSRLHPRCGTSFLLSIVVLSILVFSLISPPQLWVKLVLRLALLPLLAGIAYEFMRLTSKSNSSFARVLVIPGLALQRLTTREPDLEQLEVALAALKGVIDPEAK